MFEGNPQRNLLLQIFFIELLIKTSCWLRWLLEILLKVFQNSYISEAILLMNEKEKKPQLFFTPSEEFNKDGKKTPQDCNLTVFILMTAFNFITIYIIVRWNVNEAMQNECKHWQKKVDVPLKYQTKLIILNSWHVYPQIKGKLTEVTIRQ